MIGGKVASTSTQFTPAQVEAIMSGDIPEGWRVVSIFVPSRAFRVIASPEEREFKVQQRNFKTDNKWLSLSLHKNLKTFEAYGAAWTQCQKNQVDFLTELRRQKVEHKRMVTHAAEMLK